MKTLPITLFVICFTLFSSFNSLAQGIGINSIGVAPDASAILDLNTTNKGFLITRVDTLSIPSPAFGLLTLSPVDSCLYLFNGKGWMGMGGGGSVCSCNCKNAGGSIPTFPCGGTVIPIVDVVNPKTGKTWMDRNLGASQVATSSTDAAAYGDFYQWGRCSDGHEKRTSGTTKTLSHSDTPGHGDLITTSAAPSDWRSPQNDNLWQGVNGINNPCPTGYRIPTDPELEAERASWITNNAAGAYASPLKLTMGGVRSNNGDFIFVATAGYYWSSTVKAASARYLRIINGGAAMGDNTRAVGSSVRCIKD